MASGYVIINQKGYWKRGKRYSSEGVVIKYERLLTQQGVRFVEDVRGNDLIIRWGDKLIPLRSIK